MHRIEDQRDGLFLDVAALVEGNAEALELVGPVAGSEAKHDPPAAQDVDEGGVLRDPHRIVERHRHHRGAEPDLLRLRSEIAHIGERVGQDAVLVAEMMLGDPGGVVAEPVRLDDLGGDARVHVAMRVGLAVGVRVRGEENAEFHQMLLSAASRANRC